MEVLLDNGVIRPDSILRHFDSIWSGAHPFTTAPGAAADVVEDADAYRIYLDMPGMKGESISLEVNDGHVVVEAERKRPAWGKETALHMAERKYGIVRRSFAIPEDANAGSIAASYRDGVLEVSVPKKPESKPLKIKVNVES
jgi:HSP20 family protein